ncbi:MAG: dolichol kinase [Halobacteriales archaeon]
MTTDEIRRRLVHIAGAGIPLAYLADATVLSGELLTWERVQFLYFLASVVAVTLEFFRLVVGLEWWVYRRLTREYEQTNPAGYALYMLGSAIAALAFDPRVAVPALLALSLVDPLSGLLSRRSHRRVKRPFVLVVTFLASFALGAAFVPLPAAALGGVTVTVADGIKPSIGGVVLDDNFTIPVAASVAIRVGIAYLPATPSLV